MRLKPLNQAQTLASARSNPKPFVTQQGRERKEVNGSSFRGTYLDRVGGQSEPPDLLLLLADDVHGHQDVEGVVDASPDVLLVVLLVGRRSAPEPCWTNDQYFCFISIGTGWEWPVQNSWIGPD